MNRTIIPVAVVASIAFAVPAHADGQQDQDYLQALSSMGLTGDHSSIGVAQFTCERMDKAKADNKDPVTAAVSITILNFG